MQKYSSALVSANDTDVDDTLGEATYPLDTHIITTTDKSASIAKGRLWSVGTIETSTTFYPMNEQFRPLSASIDHDPNQRICRQRWAEVQARHPDCIREQRQRLHDAVRRTGIACEDLRG